MISKSKPLFVSFHKSINVIALLIFLGLVSSCVTQRKVEYLHDRDKNIKAFKEAEFSDYKLKPNDELYIQINSLDEAAANVFSNGKQDPYLGSMQPYGASLMSYSIDKEGYLLLPVIGKILVKDKTLSEVSVILKDSLNHILNQPVVTVKLVNRYISVLGEVRNPGHFPYSQDKLTIYDALGLAGDITDYGNRNQVILIRNVNGEDFRINVNITKSDILASDYYNLRPNDIVYVKPLRNKFWGMRQFPFTILFSTLTTGLLIYNIFK
jgi:polysaccharide export outer membrane protein